MDPRAAYEAGGALAKTRLGSDESKIRALSAARLVVAGLIVAVIVGFVWGHLPGSFAVVLVALVLAFFGLVIVHSRAFDAKSRSEATLRFHARGLARLDGTWRAFPSTGQSYLSDGHPFAEDLDVFGRSSLFQLLDATETPFGRDALAGILSTPAVQHDGASSWQAEVAARQEAVRELAPALTWRSRFSVEGAVVRTETPDPAQFLRWAEGASPLDVPGFVVIAARLLPLVALAVALVGPAFGLPKYAWAAVVLIELATSAQYREGTRATLDAVSDHAGGFARYGALFGAAISETWSTPRLISATAPLRGSGASGGSGAHGGVVAEMHGLERLVGFVEARRNEVFKLFIGPVLMWDLNFAVLVERWRRRSGSHIRPWFAALGEVEAFASVAGFAFDRPDHVFPQLEAEAQLSAKGVGHPLIDAARRVGNDVDLPHKGSALVVTGSNMSGKSTLLRALGVNTVLAQAGAPVAAKSFRTGEVTLATSMRVKDSLEEGVSHFYAELQKLKRVVDLAQKPPPLLFLLDEILHGTNSRERIIGARSVVLGLLQHGALGALSTHDLGIADLAEAVPGGVKNVHFEEQVADDGTMTFDYRLREGTVQSSNALRLMRAIGLDVPLSPETSLPDRPPAA